jgi:hypothetical protein
MPPIDKFLISNSTINSGLFKVTGIKNSIIINDKFDNLDKTLTISNTNQLRLVNTLFGDTNNQINSGVIDKLHVLLI